MKTAPFCLLRAAHSAGLCSGGNFFASVGLHAEGVLASLLEGSAVGRILLRRPVADFFFDGLFAVAGVGVVAEELGRHLSTLCCQGPEEVGHGLRVVSSLIKDDGADLVGLRFVTREYLRLKPCAVN